MPRWPAAENKEYSRPPLQLSGTLMQRTVLFLAAFLVVASSSFQAAMAQERTEDVFRARVDLVSVAAVVRDHHGRIVRSLTRDDFEVFDSGHAVPILDLQGDDSSPASVALLVDGSGSMRLGAALDRSRRIGKTVLGGLDGRRDSAALFSFDTRLLTLRDFTGDFDVIRRELHEIEAWGSTSLYDAIAGTAGVVADRARTRRALIVLTDGGDTTSTYSPEAVAVIASSIDVPVYVFSLGESDSTSDGKPGATPENALAALARATGGDLFVASTEAQISAAVGRVLDELRHQYVFAFKGSDAAGVHPVEIRTRQPKMRVTARKWYRSSSGE
jgi:Ca-activated chloride channel family protein